MKITFCYLTGLFIFLTVLTACKKMDSNYKKFIVYGGITYVGPATSAVAYSGHNRVKVSWLRSGDPNVSKARIFWNNNTDSVEFDIPPTGDTINYIINNLPEKSYSFIIRTYDGKGNSSVPIALLSSSYGENYQSSLLNRSINLSTLDITDKVSIEWGGADISNGAYETEVKYTDNLGNIKNQRFPTNVSTSTISDIKPGTRFLYRTAFKPDSLSIDDYFTDYAESGDFNIDKKGWKIIAYSTQHDDGDNAVANFIDGTDATRWHTNASTSKYPHFATIDMGVERTITKFGVWITTFATPGGDLRGPDKIQFLTSLDNITWTNLGIFNFNRFLLGEQNFNMPTNLSARYFKFVGVSGPNTYMVMGEISAYGL